MTRQQNYKKSAKDRDYTFAKNNHTHKRCVKVINQNINETSYFLSHKPRCYTRISGPEKSHNNSREKKSYFFMYVDIANHLLTRHSPLAPLGQVDE